MGLSYFLFADGVCFGIGTTAELDDLKREGIAPADAIAQPLTDADVRRELAA